jgi:hypothetical protein
MEVLIVLLFGALTWYAVTSSSRSKVAAAPTPQQSSDTQRKRFLAAIPKGYQLLADRLSITGVQFRKQEALRFAAAGGQSLRLEREPTNTYDANAVKVIGTSDGGEHFLGYLPREIAKQVAEAGLFEAVRPHLTDIFVGHNQYIDIGFQLIGPTPQKAKFDDYLRQQPPSSEQAAYLRFFRLISPKGITTADAERVISHHRETSTDDEKGEWRAYASILAQFDDPDFRDDCDLPKISRADLSRAIEGLKKQGKDHRYIEENIDELVDAILDSTPEEAQAA